MARLGFDPFDEVARDRVERVCWDLAQDLLRLGASVILESGFWLRSERDEKRLAARDIGVPVELRYLDVQLDELVRRVERRYQSEIGAVRLTRVQLEGWLPLFEPPDDGELALFDPPN